METNDSTGAIPPRQAVIPKGLLRPEEEVILALKPSGWFVLLVSARFCQWLAVILLFAWVLDWSGALKLSMDVVLLAGVAAALIRLLVACLQWICRTYVLTTRRIIRVKGVLWVRIFECGLARVQNTTLSQPLLQRVLRTGTLFFATAGTAGSDAAWLIIAKPALVHQFVVQWVERAQALGGPAVP